MCGICGIYSPEGIDTADREAIPVMTQSLFHRGPDGSGIHLSDNIALGHRRLSIVDIDGGTQPMPDEGGRAWTVFNGEIYNFNQIKSGLMSKGCEFRTRSDTEVIPNAYLEYGDEFVARLQGMFAFSLWDEAERRLILARDRVGKKPLYYGWFKGRFIFASEIKAILLHPYVEREVDIVSLSHSMSFQHVPAGRTVYRNIYKLLPASVMTVAGTDMKISKYWQPGTEIDRRKRQEEYYVGKIVSTLKESVRERLMGDVPIGAFLSGGVDSSAVVALMSECVPERVHTFSIGFDDPSYDETDYAKTVSDMFGTKHTVFRVTGDELLESVGDLVWYSDEPFADSSILPTYFLSKMTREHVTVALSGDGGDELFGGYERYVADRLLHYFSKLLPFDLFKKYFSSGAKRISDIVPFENVSHRLGQLAGLAVMNDAERHLNWFSFFSRDEKKELFGGSGNPGIDGVFSTDVMESIYSGTESVYGDFTGKQLMVDFMNYLPETLMMKVDRAGMACSLEVRCPILSTEMVNLAHSIPSNMKIRGKTTKYILKRAFEGKLPDEILFRRKKGFEVPLNKWFRGKLRDMSYDILTGSKFSDRGVFNAGYVQMLLDEHSSQKCDHGHKLWMLLMTELWFRTFIDAGVPERIGNILR
ncbi:MAG TPA: asparagine synthase (glutamine-hydrolyzing) [bacterium]|nr:asparagine synthase (glutamine-hydrolyzing) [bacterium]